MFNIGFESFLVALDSWIGKGVLSSSADFCVVKKSSSESASMDGVYEINDSYKESPLFSDLIERFLLLGKKGIILKHLDCPLRSKLKFSNMIKCQIDLILKVHDSFRIEPGIDENPKPVINTFPSKHEVTNNFLERVRAKSFLDLYGRKKKRIRTESQA